MPRKIRAWPILSGLAGLASGSALLLTATPAHAVPAFARQTGLPCAMCHVGAFGPQLTQFGRAFKIGGYTQTGGEGLKSEIPLSAMALGSFNHTAKDQQPPPQYFNSNNNFALDQASLFVAGHVGAHTGALMQFTYDGVGKVYGFDNIDIVPYTTTIDLGNNELRIGTTINNNPTVQDPYNIFAWGYPYVGSPFDTAGVPSPFINGTLAQNSIGYTVYGWYNNSLYLEGGVYTSENPWILARTGADYGTFGRIQGPAPYLRAAYEWDWNGQEAHVGALFMHVDIDPMVKDGGPYQTTGTFGQDHYTDYAFDTNYRWVGDGTNIFNVAAIFTHEEQDLPASAAIYDVTGSHSFGLNQMQVHGSYWYKNTYGLTLSWQHTWGSNNPVLAANTTYDSPNPNGNSYTVEADWVPFGKQDSWAQPFVNMKLGVQYTLYTQVNGVNSHAGDNNVLYAFAWLAF